MTKTKPEPILLPALSAGVCITIGCAIYLALLNTNRALGAVFFSLGLLTICVYQFKLFTGVCGYLINPKLRKGGFFTHLKFIIYVWCGNMFGCYLTGRVINATSTEKLNYAKLAADLWENKVALSTDQLVGMGFFCGILMFLAVHTWKQEKVNILVKVLMIIACVAVFILCGFEHCVADMSYLFIGGANNFWSCIYKLLIITFGNILGGVMGDLMTTCKDKMIDKDHPAETTHPQVDKK